MIPATIARESALSDANVAFPGDPEGWWSPNRVVPEISVREEAARIVSARYSDELLEAGTDGRVGDGIRTRDIQIHNLVP
jgi:hypothetical protein